MYTIFFDLHSDNNNKPASTASTAATSLSIHRLVSTSYLTHHLHTPLSISHPSRHNSIVEFQSISWGKKRITKPNPSGNLPLDPLPFLLLLSSPPPSPLPTTSPPRLLPSPPCPHPSPPFPPPHHFHSLSTRYDRNLKTHFKRITTSTSCSTRLLLCYLAITLPLIRI